MMPAERIAGKSKYAGNQFLQFDREGSLTRPIVRVVGHVNGGLEFETAYILNKTSAQLINVFYAYKSFLMGVPHHPIYSMCIFQFM